MAELKSRLVENQTGEEGLETRKVGFGLSPETDFKLTVFARKHRKSRSEVVEEALANLLRGVVISFRNNSGKTGDVA